MVARVSFSINGQSFYQDIATLDAISSDLRPSVRAESGKQDNRWKLLTSPSQITVLAKWETRFNGINAPSRYIPYREKKNVITTCRPNADGFQENLSIALNQLIRKRMHEREVAFVFFSFKDCPAPILWRNVCTRRNLQFFFLLFLFLRSRSTNC